MKTVIELAREAGYGDHMSVLHEPALERFAEIVRADNRNRWEHNYEVLMNALWKACGDDAQVVEATIESQGELK